MLSSLPYRSPAELRSRRVLVCGLGTKGGGAEAARWLLRHGALVTVTDRKSAAELGPAAADLERAGARMVLGEHRAEDVDASDIVLRNPAVPLDTPLLQRAATRGIPVVMDTTLFFQFCPAPIAGVTGTRGKSTTTAVAGEILRRSQPTTVVSGNIARSPLADLDAIRPDTPVVLELSSWQLEGIEPMQRSPQWAVLTTILPDHLNRYPSMHAYVAAKEAIVKYQSASDVALLPLDEPSGGAFAIQTPAQRRWFGTFQDIPVVRTTVERLGEGKPVGLFRVGDRLVRLQESGEETILQWGELGGIGDHTKRNMLAGALLALEMGAPLDDMREVLTTFRGLPNRLEVIREYQDRTFVNDTAATTPEAVVAALRAFPGRHIVLITGGTDKNLDYRGVTSLVENVREGPREVVLLAGSATEKILASFDREVPTPVRTMAEAVALAWKVSRPGDVILLSPGAASFELFRDEFDRGAQFHDAVARLSA